MTLQLSQHTFWDQAAISKQFQDPFYLEELLPFIDPNSLIIEYGCGYGRILQRLHESGFSNSLGFDFSQGMIQRGTREFPHLQLQHIQHATLPLANTSVDCAIISTVLCCIPDEAYQVAVINEIHRILKPGAALYLTDFLLSDTPHMQQKYQKDLAKYNEYGVYQTTEGAVVRHFTPEHVQKLLKQFDTAWYREEEFMTMNNNPVKTFHGVYLTRHSTQRQ